MPLRSSFAAACRLRFIACACAVASSEAGIRSVYGPNVNPAPYSLASAVNESTLDFAWTPASRPFPGPFGALWTATLSPASPSVPIWFRASFGSTVGSFFKLWVDDHFIINAQANALNTSTVSLYPLSISPRGSLLRVEFGVIGDNASARLEFGASATGPWEVVPAGLLVPALTGPEDTYQEQRSIEETGWNTWDQTDMLSSVLLPSGLEFSLSFFDAGTNATTGTVGVACSGLRVGLHAARGNYTEVETLDLAGGAAVVRVETATTPAGDLVIAVTTVSATRPADVTLRFDARNMLPFSACVGSAAPGALNMTCAGEATVSLRPAIGGAATIPSSTAGDPSSFVLPLPAPGASAAFSTAPGGLTLSAALEVVSARRAELIALFSPWGPAMNETFAGLFTAVSWTAIYSHSQGIVNGEFGRSDQLFEWDTFLAGALAARVDRWMAFNNIIRIVKGAVPAGFAPGYIRDQYGEVDNSKPQVGALVLRAVFDRFQEPWLVELTIDALTRFNAWWAGARLVAGLVAPGSYLDPALAPIEQAGHGSLQAAKWETGLDNSPLYDNATFDTTTWLMSQWDVGLHALYVADALALARLAQDVGRGDLVPDLTARAAAAAERLEAELWDEGAEAYLNKDYVTGASVPWAGPPAMYPLIAGVPSVAQVERMLSRYYFNASEWCGGPECAYGLPSITRASPAFAEQNYWRGRVWGPMNYLVWLGLKAYAAQSPLAASAVQALALQSRTVFLQEWLANHHVMENYDAIDGSGCTPGNNANPFYHWGALTALIAVEEAPQPPPASAR